jgi:hypothetical protein
MKLLISVLIVGIFSGNILADDKVSFMFDTRVGTSRLLDPGLTLYSDPVWRSRLSAQWKNGFGLHLFHVTGFGECFENASCRAQELKPEISYTTRVDDWQLHGNIAYSAFGELGTIEGDFFQMKARIQYKSWSLEPYLETNYQYLLGSDSGMGLTQIGADWSISIAPAWYLKLNSDIAYDSAPFRDNGWLVRGHADLWYKLNPDTQVGVWIKARKPITQFTSDRDGAAVGVGLQYTW